MSEIHESSVIEDMKSMQSVGYLWTISPTLRLIGQCSDVKSAQLTLSFGVNDLDGTIDDSTRIYSMAGSEEQNPSLSTRELVALIKQVNREPVERDTLYNEIRNYKNIDA